MTEELRSRILKEMTSNFADALERNFEMAKSFVNVTQNGKVHIMVDKEKLGGKEQILLYCIGKLYAKEAGLSDSEGVSNKELMEELGLPKGSVLPWTKDLRDKKRIITLDSGAHTISANMIEKSLKEVEEKLKGK